MTNQQLRRSAILGLMQDGNVWTSEKLARHTGVSQRTIYRDLAVLAKRHKIVGTIAVGYVLRKG